MTVLERFNIPRRLASRIWLLTVPSAVLSFERRQKVPPLPIGQGRFAGLALVAAGVAAIAMGRRARPQSLNGRRGISRFQQRPAVGGGLLALIGVGVLLRSTALTAYALGLAVGFATDVVELEEPQLPGRSSADTAAWDYTDTLV